jgi:predicted nucleotidyltransferase
MRQRALRLARNAVVTTAAWPVAGSAYRSIYRYQVARLRRALARSPGIAAVLLRGSANDRVQPGLSDIDLAVVLDPRLDAEAELSALDELQAVVSRINLGAPLIRDIHVIAEDELAAWARLSVYLLAALEVDSVALVGNKSLPRCSSTDEIVRESLLRGACWWTDKGIRQLMTEPDRLGRTLAARSFAKARRFVDALKHAQLDLYATMSSYNRDRVSGEADHADALKALRELDAVLHAAPPVAAQAQFSEATPAGVARYIEAHLMPLRSLPALVALVLSREGACEHDQRLWIVVDPNHVEAAATLAAIGRALSRAPRLPAEHFARCTAPVVVTARQLERPIFQRWTALEPVARLRHGRVLHGYVGVPRASPPELARALAYDLCHAGTRSRELFRGKPDARAAAQWSDLSRGLLPAARELVEKGSYSTRYAASDLPAKNPQLVRLLADRRQRVRLYAELRREVRTLLPRLLDLGATAAERPDQKNGAR